MRVPISWLKEYVDITLPVEELAHRLTLAGLEVGSVEYVGIPAHEAEKGHRAVPVSTGHLVWDREKIVVGHILEVQAHPNADRLVLAVVDSGLGETETVVTGAPNLYPYRGRGPLDPPLVSPYAREGAEVIDGHKEDGSRLIIKPRNLRGIENKSMVCSAKELGIADDHEGIMLLDGVDAPPGTPLQDVLGDAILDIELTPNMARNYSMIGVAREVAALTGQKLRYPSLEIQAAGPSIQGQVSIDIREPELNPRFTLALIKDVTIAPSPEWMQRRLRQAGMRPINNIVDITNYVMLETGQPLHAFDYDVLVQRAGGSAPTIITRLPDPGETLTTLDGVTRQLDPFTILVADTAGALSLGGIMGGAESEIYDASTYVLDAQGMERKDDEKQHGKVDARPQSTQNVLLEAAAWNYINIRQTLSAQQRRGKEITSEAATRFSRGVHPTQAEAGLRRAIELMRLLGGGEVAQGIIDEYPRPERTITVDLPMREVERLIGIPLSQQEVASILTGLEFDVERVGADALRVTVPPHRLDIGYVHRAEDEDIASIVAQADLIEEVARIYGYDRIPDTLIADELPPQRGNEELEQEERVRDALIRAGLQEIVAYRLTTPEREVKLTPPGAPSNWPDLPYITLANPMTADKVVMRHTLLAGMLETLAANARSRDRQVLFEIGRVYLPAEGQTLPDEPTHVAIAMTGRRTLPTWQDGASEALMDYFDLKGVVEGLVDALHVQKVSFEACEHNTFFPGRTAYLKVGKRVAGTLGELHPLVAQAYELPEQPILIAELDLQVLAGGAAEFYEVKPVSNFPAVFQDIAVVVDEETPAARVEQTIWQAGGNLLREVRLFDVFRGEQIGANKKSLAYSLAFQADDKTLRDKDADALRARIIRALESNVSGKLRS